jgi:hypothetical protein
MDEIRRGFLSFITIHERTGVLRTKGDELFGILATPRRIVPGPLLADGTVTPSLQE